jgi:hypothetical protein
MVLGFIITFTSSQRYYEILHPLFCLVSVVLNSRSFRSTAPRSWELSWREGKESTGRRLLGVIQRYSTSMVITTDINTHTHREMIPTSARRRPRQCPTTRCKINSRRTWSRCRSGRSPRRVWMFTSEDVPRSTTPVALRI